MDSDIPGNVPPGVTTPEDIRRMRILLPHWIEHNAEHAAEFERWSTCVADICEDIQRAIHMMEAANEALNDALTRLGGPLEAGEAGEHGHKHA